LILSIGVGGSLGHVCNKENNGENKAERTYNDVANSKEVVFATQHISGGQNETLAAIEGVNGISVIDGNPVFASRKIGVNLSPKLTEVR